MENLVLKDRILKILNTENISSAKFADMIGVQRSNISHILSGRNNPGLDFLQKVLLKFPTINSDWLLIGKGEMYKQLDQTELKFENQPNLFSNPGLKKTAEINSPKEAEIQTIIPKQRFVKQVMIFYDDNTYEVLNPEKAEPTKDKQ